MIGSCNLPCVNEVVYPHAQGTKAKAFSQALNYSKQHIQLWEYAQGKPKNHNKLFVNLKTKQVKGGFRLPRLAIAFSNSVYNLYKIH